MIGKAALWLGLVACLPVACVSFRDQVKVHSQRIEVTSQPSGAVVSVGDEDGVRNIGRTPTSFDASYTVTERNYDKASCALAGSAAAADAVDDGGHSEADAVIGLVAMVAGAAAGAAECSAADGVVAVESTPVTVEAQLAGYRPEKVSFSVPKRRSSVHFDLVPLAQAGPAGQPAEARAAPAAEPGQARLALFDIVDTSGELDPAMLADVSQALKTALLDSAARFGYAVDADAALAARGEKSPAAFADRMQATRGLGAERLLDVRLVKVKGACYLSASVTDAAGGEHRLLSSQQATCDKDGLLQAADRIADLLFYPPRAETK